MLTIGLLGDELHYSIPQNLLNALKKQARKRWLRFLYFTAQPLQHPNEFYARSNILYNMINSKVLDGLIICSNLLQTHVSADTFLEKFQQYKSLPMVSLGAVYPHIPGILVNNEQGMYNAVSHLIEVHHLTRIAFISGPADHQDAAERFSAYCRALSEHHITLDDNLLLTGDFGGVSARKAVRELIDQRKQIPGKDFQAIVCCNDYMAIGAMRELQDHDYSIPGDLALIGFDDIFKSSLEFGPPTL